jgi:hypothetical protein
VTVPLIEPVLVFADPIMGIDKVLSKINPASNKEILAFIFHPPFSIDILFSPGSGLAFLRGLQKGFPLLGHTIRLRRAIMAAVGSDIQPKPGPQRILCSAEWGCSCYLPV